MYYHTWDKQTIFKHQALKIFSDQTNILNIFTFKKFLYIFDLYFSY